MWLAAAALVQTAGAGEPRPLAAGYTAFYGRDASVPFQQLGGVAVDSAHGEIIVSDTGRHEVAAFDTNGVWLGVFLHEVPGTDGDAIDGYPTDLAVDRAGRILVSDQKVPWVDVVTVRGKSVARLELPTPDNDPTKSGAGAIAVRSDGVIAVGTRGDSGRVYLFDRDYRRIGGWGVAGADSGMLFAITGMAWTKDQRLVVACARTKLAVQIFDAQGAFQKGFGVHDVGWGNFSQPGGMAVLADGRLWVADQIRQIVQVFDGSGVYLGEVGGFGAGSGEFQYPAALGTDGGDLLTVVEQAGRRIQVMRAR